MSYLLSDSVQAHSIIASGSRQAQPGVGSTPPQCACRQGWPASAIHAAVGSKQLTKQSAWENWIFAKCVGTPKTNTADSKRQETMRKAAKWRLFSLSAGVVSYIRGLDLPFPRTAAPGGASPSTVGPADFRVLCPRKPGAQRVEKIFSPRCPYFQNL